MQSRALPLTHGHSSDAGKGRLSLKVEPFLSARWERVVFLHFALKPALLRSQLRTPFELQLYEGEAVISIVAVTMRRFRPARPASIAAWPFALISRQDFLNVRTYVRAGAESGALFVWGWLSEPFRVPLPSGMFGLPYSFATLRCDHLHETGSVSGIVTTPIGSGRFAYRASIDPDAAFVPCRPGPLCEFALERYTGFYCRGNERRVFRARHSPWLQAPIAAAIEDRSLLDTAFPWFNSATLIGASYAPGFDRVLLGKANPLGALPPRRHRGLSTLFEMP
jgi:uncharacterized protein YqjF (DUF2071 family)